MKSLNQGHYPMFLKIKGKKCVVVGGGEVARRKVRGLLECGANVEVISPDPCRELNKLVEAGEIKLLRRRYQPGDLQGAFLAIAATDDSQINRRVLKEAKEKAVPVNVANDAEDSDFILPSCLRRGALTIAVSTAGISPALARKIRTRLEKDFGDEYASLVRLVGEVRAELKRQGIKLTGDDWQEALDLDFIFDLLKRGEGKKAKAVLLDKLVRTRNEN
jgi:precorrin-2 dehydrogenase/sirohydrochlorin ferrochelatase